MIKEENSRYGIPRYILYPGEYIATAERSMISTVVGRCVSLSLFDTTRRIGGMTSFVIPGTIGTEDILADEIFSTGTYRIELLVGEMVKLGADRHNFEAKVFGGAFPLNNVQSKALQRSTEKFFYEYFALEKIRVVARETGGEFRRQIVFLPHNGKIMRKILKNNSDMSEYIKLENEYIDSTFRNKEHFGRVMLFD